MNKGKKSLAVDLANPAAHELLAELIGSAGTFLTNFPARGWMAPERLVARRADLVMVAITGNRDGTTAVDYTINAGDGVPDGDRPRRRHGAHQQRAAGLGPAVRSGPRQWGSWPPIVAACSPVRGR